MARQSDTRGGGGCVVIIGILIVLFIVVWTLSAIGHALGLTPTYGELTDRPDGWVSRHYRGVVWGYLLIVVTLGVAALLLWLAARTQSDDPRQSVVARERLRQTSSWAVLLVIAIVALPIGKRPGVDTSAGRIGAAREGNVPNVVGMTADGAEAALDAASLTAEFHETPYEDARCRVFAQDPAAGSELDDYGTVELRCRTRVPTVVGMKAERAESRLYDAGFDVRYANEPADYDYSRCRVLRQRPTGSAEPEATIGLRLRCRKPKPAPAPAAPPASNCDPNYVGACLDPTASDYDCAGGSGDGPEYTGPVTVVGEDRFRLDSNDNGEGCE